MMSKHYLRVAAGCALSIILAGCHTHRPGITSSFEETVALQNRINRYFHAQVIPKLRECWRGIQGEGIITMAHSYKKDGKGGWVPGELTVSKSMLLKQQDHEALVCMREAVKDTSMPVGKIEQEETEFVLHWTWPVPLPSEFPRRAVLFVGPGGGIGIDDDDDVGCDGFGSLPDCQTCSGFPENECMSVCVGYEECASNIDTCVAKKACASGGPFGSVGSLGIIAQ